MLKIFLEFGLICFKREERKVENVSELVMCAPNLFYLLITDGKNELRKNSVRQNMFGTWLRFLKFKNCWCCGTIS